MNLNKTDLQNILVCIDQTLKQNGLQGGITLCLLGNKVDAEIKRVEQEELEKQKEVE